MNIQTMAENSGSSSGEETELDSDTESFQNGVSQGEGENTKSNDISSHEVSSCNDENFNKEMSQGDKSVSDNKFVDSSGEETELDSDTESLTHDVSQREGENTKSNEISGHKVKSCNDENFYKDVSPRDKPLSDNKYISSSGEETEDNSDIENFGDNTSQKTEEMSVLQDTCIDNSSKGIGKYSEYGYLGIPIDQKKRKKPESGHDEFIGDKGGNLDEKRYKGINQEAGEGPSCSRIEQVVGKLHDRYFKTLSSQGKSSDENFYRHGNISEDKAENPYNGLFHNFVNVSADDGMQDKQPGGEKFYGSERRDTDESPQDEYLFGNRREYSERDQGYGRLGGNIDMGMAEKPNDNCSFLMNSHQSGLDMSRMPIVPPQENPYTYIFDLCDSAIQSSLSVTKPYTPKKQKIHMGDKPFSCDLCSYSTNHPSALRRHKQTHTKEKRYKCNLCGLSTDYSKSFKSHMEKFHGQAGLVPSNNESMDTSEKPFKCGVCTLCNVWCNDLEVHKCGAVEEKRYSCDTCDYTTNYSSAIHRHMRMHSGIRPHACDQCDYTAICATSLKRHKMTHLIEKPFASDYHGHSAEARSQQLALKGVIRCNGVYKCDMCDFTSVWSSNVKKHRRRHTDKGPFTCDVCDFTTKFYKTFKDHKKTHIEDKPYKCNLCDFSAEKSSAVKKHLKTHTERKLQKCELCEFTSTNPNTMLKHQRMHNGENPYQCDLCDYTTTHSNALTVHRRVHTREKPYKCELCSYSAAQFGTLMKHKLVHAGLKPYKCSVCDYQATNTSTLSRHMRIHTGESPYKCDMCDYSSVNSSNLKRHKRKHTGEVPYSCHLCEYKTTNSGNLNRHMKKHRVPQPNECDVSATTMLQICENEGTLETLAFQMPMPFNYQL